MVPVLIAIDHQGPTFRKKRPNARAGDEATRHRVTPHVAADDRHHAGDLLEQSAGSATTIERLERRSRPPGRIIRSGGDRDGGRVVGADGVAERGGTCR
jgi:hypothetical protein